MEFPSVLTLDTKFGQSKENPVRFSNIGSPVNSTYVSPGIDKVYRSKLFYTSFNRFHYDFTANMDFSNPELINGYYYIIISAHQPTTIKWFELSF